MFKQTNKQKQPREDGQSTKGPCGRTHPTCSSVTQGAQTPERARPWRRLSRIRRLFRLRYKEALVAMCVKDRQDDLTYCILTDDFKEK